MSIHAELKSRLVLALKARDRDAVAALRGALAAIDNATAVPLAEAETAARGATVGVGTNDVAPRALHEGDLRRLVQGDADELRESAAVAREADTARADALSRQADVLDDVLANAASNAEAAPSKY